MACAVALVTSWQAAWVPQPLLPPEASPGKLRVYHYTDEAGYRGILKCGHIRPSDISLGDASYGSHVYATELDPSMPFYEILRNNYDMDGGIRGRAEDKKDRADYVFAFDLPEDSVAHFDSEGERSVLGIGNGENLSIEEAACHAAARAADALIKFKIMRIYHYTDHLGLQGILENGEIRNSNISMGNESFTSVVHATALGPSTPFFTILENNYAMDDDIAGRAECMKDRADCVVVLEVPNCRLHDFDDRGRRSVLGIVNFLSLRLEHHALCAGPAADVALVLEDLKAGREPTIELPFYNEEAPSFTGLVR